MKTFLITITIIIIGSGCYLQQPPVNRLDPEGKPPKIKGKIVDNIGQAIAYASIALYRASDSVMITGAASDEKGFFQLNADPGEYYIKAFFLSYEEMTTEIFRQTSDGIDIGNITLVLSAVSLDEVEVIAERSQMELHLDKRVFNIGKDLGHSGSNALEIMENIPSVSIDVDGNVSLRGSENVRILIDGKPSGLVGIANNDALEQLNGSMIESIEIITNPSARYDAEGEVGIINIILRKENREGIHGVFDVSVGDPANYNATYSINFRKKYFNLFSSYGFGYRRHEGNGYSWQQYTGDTSYVYERDREHERGGLNHNFRIGSDFFLNSSNTLTLAGMYRYGNRNNDAVVTYNDFNAEDVLTQTIVRDDQENETKNNLEASLSYKKEFRQKERQLTADVRYMLSEDTELSDITQTNSTILLPVLQKSSNEEDERNLLFQIDYVHPFRGKGKLETGVKSTFRTINNDYRVEELTDDIWIPLSGYVNHFIYTENIHAAYIIASYKMDRFSYQLGVRTELSEIRTELTETNDINDRLYNDFFPSIHISYKLDKKNSLQLSYSKRLSRPRFRHLLPFYSFVDNRNFFGGNPNLDPEYTHSFELGYLSQGEKGSILSTLYYRYRLGVIERITTVDTAGLIRVLPVNLSTQDAYGVEFNVNLRPVRWMNLNGNVNFYRAITEGSYEGLSLNNDAYRWDTRFSTKLKLTADIDFQTSFIYRAPSKTTQGEAKSMYWLDSGISKEIFRSNGTLALKVSDVLNSRKWRSTVEEEGLLMETEFQWRSRQIVLSLNYRLNQSKKRNGGYNSQDFNGDDVGF